MVHNSRGQDTHHQLQLNKRVLCFIFQDGQSALEVPAGYASMSYEKRLYSFAGVQGIPHAFVVDGEGKIRYSGHPAQPDFATTVDKYLGLLKPATVSILFF